ncbi:MAG TPA: hypothetical protein VFX78_00325 [Candidatus Eisenbacteria bacterium]|nr:hypothetical protein [Candidatus Eisenbacteria bacterium]
MKALSMIVAWIVAVVLIVPGSALAGTKAQADVDNAHHSSGPGFLVSSGAVEFSPTVTFTHQNFKREGYGNVDHFTQLDVKPTVGFCVSDHYEVMAGFLARHTSVNGDDDTALGATAGLTYNFSRHGSVIPFVGLGFGALFYDGFTMDNTAVLAPMLTGGVRVPVGGMAAVNMSVGYQHESNADGEFNASANRIVASVGVSLFPWRTR